MGDSGGLLPFIAIALVLIAGMSLRILGGIILGVLAYRAALLVGMMLFGYAAISWGPAVLAGLG